MTDTVKHTPGPWFAKWSRYREGVFFVQAGMPSNRILARFDGDGDGPDAQSIADARLIAAAPDMLEALKAAFVFTEEVKMNDRQLEAFKLMEAAIAKAEGRS